MLGGSEAWSTASASECWFEINAGPWHTGHCTVLPLGAAKSDFTSLWMILSTDLEVWEWDEKNGEELVLLIFNVWLREGVGGGGGVIGHCLCVCISEQSNLFRGVVFRGWSGCVDQRLSHEGRGKKTVLTCEIKYLWLTPLFPHLHVASAHIPTLQEWAVLLDLPMACIPVWVFRGDCLLFCTLLYVLSLSRSLLCLRQPGSYFGRV